MHSVEVTVKALAHSDLDWAVKNAKICYDELSKGKDVDLWVMREKLNSINTVLRGHAISASYASLALRAERVTLDRHKVGLLKK